MVMIPLAARTKTGYLETVAEIVGGGVTAWKVRQVIKRCVSWVGAASLHTRHLLYLGSYFEQVVRPAYSTALVILF